MRFRAVLLAAVTTLAMVGPGTAVDAWAIPPAPTDLTVIGGEEAWHPTNSFYLTWRNPETSLPILAAGYLVRDGSGTVVREGLLGWAATGWSVSVPTTPGVYTAEVWLMDMIGGGPHSVASLRYDDRRPPSTTALQPDGWIARSDFPHLIRIQHPPGELPLSGIRGYAVSIDQSPEGQPCAGPSMCTETETDLRGGPGDDTLAIPELPEGANHVHVVAVSGSGMRSAEAGDTILRVDRTDPVTQVSGLPNGWTDRAVTITVTASDSGSGMTGQDGAFTAVQVDGGLPTVSAGNSVSTTVIGDGIHRIAHYARDAAGNVNDGATRNGVRNLAPALATVRIDRDPPQVAFLNSQDPADPELIRALVLDRLAGPTRGWIGVRAEGSGDRFQPLPTEEVSGRLLARWDSESYPPGRYEFRATGYDAAGNATSTQRRLEGTPMVLANPLKTPTRLNLGFGGETLVWHNCTRGHRGRSCRREAVTGFGHRPQSRVVPYGRGTLLSGRLTTESGIPLAVAPVRILEHFGHGPGHSERIATVGTDADGRFSIRLGAGPNREISASFDGTRTLTRSTAGSLRLGVRTEVRLQVSSTEARIGGPPVIFSGRVIAGPGEIPADGKALALQFRLPGVPWTEFRTVNTDGRGRFRYPYRFSDDDSRGVRFQFRAYAPGQSDWPYEPGSSNAVAVTGR
jgi:hypothetical protein